MDDQVKQLIAILLDKEGRWDERDDAAMYLGDFNDKRALDALLKIASDFKEDDVLIDDCALSIGKIFIQMNQFDEYLFKNMIPFAQGITFRYIIESNSELIKEPLRSDLVKKFLTEK